MITYKKFIKLLIPWIVFSFVMNMSRFALTDVHSYLYMNWNLFLAFLPLLFIFLFERSKNIYFKIISFLAWLFFLPNAIYMVTDLIHLRDVGPEWLLWFDGMMIFAYALVGIFITAFTLLKMKDLLFKDNLKRQNIFLIIISILSSFGIYLGRYVRWNTWDIITRPVDLVINIFNILRTEHLNPVFITTIIFFTLFILVTVWSLKEIFKKSAK